MEYFTVHFDARQRMGISVIQRAESDPKLGNTVVEACQDPSGPAARQGVKTGDFIVSVNGEYVACLSHVECVRRMQNLKQQGLALVVEFSRPIPDDWERLQADANAVIYEGILQKQVGLLKRWTPRLFKVSRNSLNLFAEGNIIRKTYPIQSIVLSRVHRPNSPSIEFNFGGKETVLEATDENIANRWKHAIDCAVVAAFDKPLSEKYTQGNEIDTSYLEVGRQSQPQQSRPVVPVPPPSFHQPKPVGSSASNKNPYWMLLLCKLDITSGPGGAVDVSNLPDPERLNLPRVEYQFELERKVLSQEKPNGTVKT